MTEAEHVFQKMCSYRGFFQCRDILRIALHTKAIPSPCGILVETLVTYIETRKTFLATLVLSMNLMTCVVSLRDESCICTLSETKIRNLHDELPRPFHMRVPPPRSHTSINHYFKQCSLASKQYCSSTLSIRGHRERVDMDENWHWETVGKESSVRDTQRQVSLDICSVEGSSP